MSILEINQWQIPFEIRRTKRAKRLSLKIDSHGLKVVLVTPPWMPQLLVDRFIRSHHGWIVDKWSALQKKREERPKLEHSPAYYKARARVVIRERLSHFNQHYQFDFNRVFFRDQKTRWGSCSSQRNLNFNWRLILGPSEVLDYVVVHELCHLKEMNHSPAFWSLVEVQIPDHKKWRRWLRENHLLLTF